MDLDLVWKGRDETNDRKRQVRNARLERKRHGRPVDLLEQVVRQPFGKVRAKARRQRVCVAFEVGRKRGVSIDVKRADDVFVEQGGSQRAGDRLRPLQVVADGVFRAERLLGLPDPGGKHAEPPAGTCHRAETRESAHP